MNNVTTDKIRLSREGEWFQGENPITHERTLELFSRSIVRQDDGYFLSGDKQPVAIDVEDTAYFVRALDRSDLGYRIRLSDDSDEELDPKTLSFGSENELYCQIKGGSEKAKFLRPPFYEIMKDLVEEGGYFGLRVSGMFYPLKRVPVIEAPVTVAKAPPRVVAAGPASAPRVTKAPAKSAPPRKTSPKEAKQSVSTKKLAPAKKPVKKKVLKKTAKKKKPLKKKLLTKKSVKKKVVKKKVAVKKPAKKKPVKKKTSKKK